MTIINKDIIIGDIEFVILYICDDKIGFKEILSNRTNLTVAKLNIILKKLIQFGYLKNVETKGSCFYETTTKGNNYLKQMAKEYYIDPK